MRTTVLSIGVLALATTARAFSTSAVPTLTRSFQSTARVSTLRGGGVRTMASSIHDFSLKKISGGDIKLSDYKGKVVLIENVASLWGTTTSDFTAMNSLVEQFGDKLAVLAIPCNQFGHQTNENDEEFLNTLKYVRPGNGFEPKMDLFAKVNVNGKTADPLFKYVKAAKPIPFGGNEDTKDNGCPDNMALVLSRGGFDGTTVNLWAPVARDDIAWNFEKFLIGKDGKVIERFSRYYATKDIAAHIEKAIAA